MSVDGGGGGVVTEEAAAKAFQKRYEGLVTVKNKAVKGKGAWYWAHLEPLLVYNSDNGLPKAVKLKCCLCHTVFSASNPSRTASEHLKRGTCPRFSSPPPPPSGSGGGGLELGLHAPEFDVTPTPLPPQKYNHRKRSSSSSSTGGATAGAGGVVVVAGDNNNTGGGSTAADAGVALVTSYVPPISVLVPATDPSRLFSSTEMGSQHMVPPTSGGLSDPKTMFEDTVKKFKGPNNSTIESTALSKTQIERAMDYLSDWVYESCGSVSFSSLEHPKFKSFLQQVGLSEVSKREFYGSRLDSRFEEVRNECDVRVRNAMFFQISSQGWKSEENLVNLIANLPNGTSVYRRALFTSGQTCSNLAEEVLCETIADICGNSVHRCVGIVSDKFKKSTLRNLESKFHWMINLPCQCHAFNSLINDFYNELPLFKNVAGSCLKLASIVGNKTVRNCINKYHLRGCSFSGLKEVEFTSFEPVYVMIEDIIRSARVLQLVLLDESYKLACMEDLVAREFGEMIRDVGFWNDLEAVRSLVSLVKELASEFESERPLVGQCLPLWEELRNRVKSWCVKFHIADILVDKVIETRFRKNYHPAWAAAYILDPFYMVRDTTGKFLPPFKYLSPEQHKDVHDLITRLVSREEVPIIMGELMRWRSEGLDPVYAQAVQLKQRDLNTGKMRIANPQGSRLVWETYLPEFVSLGKVALRLIFLHATARGFKCNASMLNWVQNHGRSRLSLDKAQKMVFISSHFKLERRDFTSEDDKDVELFSSIHGEDDDMSSM